MRGRDQKVCNRVQAFAGYRADQRHRSAKLPRQRKHVHLSTLFVQLVSHVEQNQRRQSQGNHAPGQDKVPVEVVGVEYQNDRIRALGAGHFAVQHIDCDFFIFRFRIETVDAGKIDQRNFLARVQTKASGVVLHGDAGEVPDLLAQSGQAIEERGFARVGRPDDGDSLIDRRAHLHGLGLRTVPWNRHRKHSLLTRPLLPHRKGRTAMQRERSRRRATSVPSTR